MNILNWMIMENCIREMQNLTSKLTPNLQKKICNFGTVSRISMKFLIVKVEVKVNLSC